MAQSTEYPVVVDPTPQPEPSGSVGPEPPVDPVPEPGPTPDEPTREPTDTPTDAPPESPGDGEVPLEEPEVVPDDSETGVRPATPPAITTADTSWLSVALALGALAVSAVLLVVFSRPGRRAEPIAGAATAVPFGTEARQDSSATLALLVTAGEAMIDAGHPVSSVRTSLEDIAEANGWPEAEVLAFPTALIVSLDSGRDAETKAVSTGSSELLLYQVEELNNALDEARVGGVPPAASSARLLAVRTAPPPFGLPQRLAGYLVLSIGLSVLLGASWAGVALAAVLGVLVGLLLLGGARLGPQFAALVTVSAAFLVAVAVFLAVRSGLDPGVLPSLVAPIVVLLPGGLLTTAVIELSTGHVMAGSARLAAGALQLVLLAFGIIAAGALVGVPVIVLDAAAQPLGAAAPWIGIALFGAGVVIHRCARRASLGWILLVLYVAYGAQVLGDILFGGVLSAFIGALVMTPVAVLVARHPTGPPTIVSFLPAFWLLVPGALGLVGVTSILDGDASGLTTLVTTIATMVAIALGVLLGLGMSGWLGLGRRGLRSRVSL